MEEKAMDSIGERVRAARENRGWSQGQLAEFSGVGRTHINLIESGKRQPKLPTITSLASALHVPVSALLVGEAPVEDEEGAEPIEEDLLRELAARLTPPGVSPDRFERVVRRIAHMSPEIFDHYERQGELLDRLRKDIGRGVAEG